MSSQEKQTTVLITGASSGLGLAFLQYYARIPSTQVIGIDISPLPAAINSSNITFHTTDITSESSLATLSQHLLQQPETSQGIDLLLHCAGIRGLVPEIINGQKRGDVAAAETFEVMGKETLMRTLEVNSWGTFNVIKSFLPNLAMSKRSKNITETTAEEGSTKAEARSSPRSSPPPKVVVLSSRMGSISSNSTGGGYAYRTSKAALNSMVKSFSLDVRDVVFLLLHPGRVETGLVQWKEEGAFGVDEVLGDCVKVINGADLRDSGRLVDRWNEDIGW